MEKAIQRQRVLLDHLQPSSSSLIFSRQAHQSTDLSASSCFAGNSSHGQRGGSEDDVVIVAAYRTAICKAKRGGFKDTLPDDLLASVLKAVIEKTKVDPAEVGDIVVGTVLAPGSDRGIECRMAAFYAGFPDTVPLRTVNRQCSSGLQAVADVAAYIKAGFYDIGIGAGLESMSNDTVNRLKNINPKVETFAQARDCLLPMGITSENVAQRYGVTRLEQDQAAVESHKRAAAATASGKFKEEIIPVSTKFVDPKTRVEKKITVSVDDGIRPNTNIMDLAKLKPAFQKDGSTTAGNASQISDGAGAVLLMKRRVALQKGLPILGIFRHLCSSLGTRYFSHKEQSQEELIRYLDILTVKLGKGSSEEEALHTLLNDETCDAIPLSQNLVHLLLQRYKDDWQSALGVFRWAGSQSSFRHSPESYDMMVDILGRMKVMQKLRDLLDEMRKSGLVTMNTVAKVMRRFVGAGQWVDAVKIFDDLQALGLEKNIDSMNLLLDTLCKEKFVEQAREIFLELKQHIAPNAHTFNIFIHGWCKICRVDEAHWTIEEMKGYGCRPCVISYSTIIRCYCQEGNFIKVYELLDEMQAQGCPANVITYTTIMSALAKAEKFEEALKVPERMRSSGCRADTLFFNSFLYTLGRAGRLDDAAYVFNVEMPKAGVSPNTSTYNSLISMFCYHAQEKRAFEILKEMENSDYCKPDAQTYHPLIKSCFRSGKIDGVLNDILNDMIKKYHLSLDLSTYTLLIHGLCRGDRCNWAFSLFEEMIDQDIIPRFRTCQLLLDEVKQKNMFQAAEKIEDLMKKLSFAAVGVDPAVMGVGPAAAIPAAVKSAGLELGNIDLYEINEAFASQYVYCCKKLGLDPRKVNVNGGAIALGHPLGATGARCVATLLNEMKRRGRDCRYGVISMCIGSGMGAAAVFERGDY